MGEYAGNGSGVSLGISSNYLGLTNSIQIRKVIYKPELQKELITGVIDGYCQLYEKLKLQSKTWDLNFNQACFTSLIDSHLTEFLYIFKRELFEDENEYRLLVKDDIFNNHNVKTNASNRHYIPVKLSQPDPGLGILPIVVMIFGNRCSTGDEVDIVKELYNRNYEHVGLMFRPKE